MHKEFTLCWIISKSLRARSYLLETQKARPQFPNKDSRRLGPHPGVWLQSPLFPFFHFGAAIVRSVMKYIICAVCFCFC